MKKGDIVYLDNNDNTYTTGTYMGKINEELSYFKPLYAQQKTTISVLTKLLRTEHPQFELEVSDE